MFLVPTPHPISSPRTPASSPWPSCSQYIVKILVRLTFGTYTVVTVCVYIIVTLCILLTAELCPHRVSPVESDLLPGLLFLQHLSSLVISLST